LRVAQTFELADLILSAIEAALLKVFTSRPGRVVSYDATRQTADVQATVRSAYTSEVGDRVSEALPLFRSVPVMFFGGGPYRTTYPVTAGDTCLVLFSDCSNDRWLAQGGTDVDPGDDRHHCLSDGVAIVGLRDFKHSLKNAPTDRMSIGHDQGATVEIHPNEVRLGSNAATNDVVVQSALDGFMSALSSAITTLGASPAGPALTALRTALQALNASAGWKAGTSKVKAE
jgi:hypothetical protein